jgi:signal transduction histidine kinase/DNA-binding NarL/FixJ family response regulator
MQLTHRPFVLIADSDRSTTQLLRGVLEHEGYRVETTSDGLQTIEIARTQRPDLVILETRLGGRTDGWQVLKSLRDTPETSRIPTFILTSSGEWLEIIEGLRLGADDYMRKPIHPRELLARAEAKIRAHRLDEALARKTTDLEALLRVSEALGQSQEWETVCEHIVTLARDLIPGQCAVVAVFTREGLTDIHSLPTDDACSVVHFLQEAVGGAGDQWPCLTKAYPDGFMLSNFPYVSQDHQTVVGLFVVSQQPFDLQYQQLFDGFCKQAGLALQNAELYRIQANYALDLERKVEERTAELQAAQKQLAQAARLASIGQLAAGIAHEINNPLLPIKLNLESIMEDVEMGLPIDVDLLQVILQSVERIQHLIRRLLRFNETKIGEYDYSQTVDIHDVMQSVVELTRKTFKQSDKQVIVEMLDERVYVKGNADALTQVFINLALNACESMEKGGILRITVEKQHNRVLMAFIDNGAGIPAELLDRIFDPFVTTKEYGSGLGLFISYGILEAHHATIEVQSKVGVGTTFKLSFPLPKP